MLFNSPVQSDVYLIHNNDANFKFFKIPVRFLVKADVTVQDRNTDNTDDEITGIFRQIPPFVQIQILFLFLLYFALPDRFSFSSTPSCSLLF